MKIKDIFLSNLLFPAISFVLIGLLAFANSKIAFVKLRELLILVLLTILLMGLSGLLVLLNIPFLPYLYLYIFLFFLFIGYYFSDFSSKVFIHSNNLVNRAALLVCTVAILLTGSYLFSIFFNLFQNLQYGFIASTCTYSLLLPLLFVWSYESLVDIPTGIFKIWYYNPSFKDFDFTSDTSEKIILLELEIRKNAQDPDIIKVKAKAPVDLNFGKWFQLFLHDYNTKYLESPIQYSDGGNLIHGWIFTKSSSFKRKLHVDPDLNISENGLQDKEIIICNRVDKVNY